MKYDVVIVGAGHNGLVAANYLSREGLKVLVVERRGVLGGMATTEELWEGFKVPTGAYVLSLFRRRIMEDLGLKLRIYLKEPSIFLPLPGGRSLTIWSSVKRTKREIERFSKRDSEAYNEWVRFWEAFAALGDYIMLTPPPSLNDLVDELRKLRFALGSGLEKLQSFVEDVIYVMTTSAGRILDEYFETSEVKAALIEDGVVGVFAGPYTPGTAYVLAHHVMGEVNGVKGAWGYVEGGMGALSEALVRSASGIDILMSTPVERIITHEGSVKGVMLANGRFVESRVVLSNADVKTTFLKLLDPDSIDASLRRRIENLRSIGVSAKVVGVIKALPRYAVNDADPLLGNKASSLIMPSVDYVERAYRDALSGGFSREPWISINIPTTYDESITKPPYHVFSIFAQYIPRHLKWSDELREELRETIYNTVEEYVPGFKELVIHDMLLTPVDIEARFGSVGGNIFHLDMLPDQLLTNRPIPGMSRYRTPIRGLYLCGADTHPGGGVTGAPGYNAAMAVLRDLGRSKGIRPRLIDVVRLITRLLS